MAEYKKAANLTAVDYNIQLGTFWQDQHFTYVAGTVSGFNMTYAGRHFVHNADTADPYWEVWKYTYDADDNCTRIEGPLVGAWDDRATLAWGA